MIPFVKMQGIGNDFVVLDALGGNELPSDLPAFAKVACDRKFGIGGDGILILENGAKEPYQMRMFNPDGSISEMCGNGVRCVAVLIHAEHRPEEIPDEGYPIETGAGTLRLKMVDDNTVRVDMGRYDLTPSSIGLNWAGGQFVNELVSKTMRGTAVSMGNPHLVIFTEDVAAIDLAHVGPILENHPWFEKKTNVHFVQVVSRGHLIQRTWERGAGITLACGTGACACAVAAFVNGLTEPWIDIDLPGGRLHIDIADDQSVFMTGPAVVTFTGVTTLAGA